MRGPWGYELIIDARAGDKARVSDGENIKAFTRDLVKRIGMVPYGEPWAECFADDADKSGHTLFQPIMTSSITGHFVDSNGDFYVNIFSCKEIDTGAAIECVQEYFSPTDMTAALLVRGKPEE